MTDAQVKPIANDVCDLIYHKLISTTKISRTDAMRAAVAAADKAAQSLQQDIREEAEA